MTAVFGAKRRKQQKKDKNSHSHILVDTDSQKLQEIYKYIASWFELCRIPNKQSSNSLEAPVNTVCRMQLFRPRAVRVRKIGSKFFFNGPKS